MNTFRFISKACFGCSVSVYIEYNNLIINLSENGTFLGYKSHIYNYVQPLYGERGESFDFNRGDLHNSCHNNKRKLIRMFNESHAILNHF